MDRVSPPVSFSFPFQAAAGELGSPCFTHTHGERAFLFFKEERKNLDDRPSDRKPRPEASAECCPTLRALQKIDWTLTSFDERRVLIGAIRDVHDLLMSEQKKEKKKKRKRGHRGRL